MFTTLFATFLAAMSTPAAPVVMPQSPLGQVNNPASIAMQLNKEEALAMSDTERAVRAYFVDTPALVEVARCESSFRHVDANGDLLRGKVNKSDVGVMQINEYYHDESAQRFGYDIKTLSGNMAFAQYLYGKYGTEPWSASSKCWKAAVAKINAANKAGIAAGAK